MTSGRIVRSTEIRVRYADTDKMGVVYNGNYLRFFEIGRTELLRDIGIPYAQLESEGYLLPVLEAHVEFVSPARYDDLITIETTYVYRVSPILELKYNIIRDGLTLARGFTRHTFVDDATFKPKRPARRFVDAVERALQSIS